MSEELISPELALVCPDLRARAIAALPPPQLWLPQRLDSTDEPLRSTPPATVDRTPADATVARAAGAYVLARTVDLLAIMVAVALFVLVFAAVAGTVRG